MNVKSEYCCFMPFNTYMCMYLTDCVICSSLNHMIIIFIYSKGPNRKYIYAIISLYSNAIFLQSIDYEWAWLIWVSKGCHAFHIEARQTMGVGSRPSSTGQRIRQIFHRLKYADNSNVYVAAKHWFKRNYSFASERLISLMKLEKIVY